MSNRAKEVEAEGKPSKEALPWHEKRFNTLQFTSQFTGVSVPSLYKLAKEGKIALRRVAGRTLVETSSIRTLVDNAPAWTPSNAGAAARARRKEIAAQTWR